jgi:hypothetical protein
VSEPVKWNELSVYDWVHLLSAGYHVSEIAEYLECSEDDILQEIAIAEESDREVRSWEMMLEERSEHE